MVDPSTPWCGAVTVHARVLAIARASWDRAPEHDRRPDGLRRPTDYVSGGRLAADASGCFFPGQEHADPLFDVTCDGSLFVSMSAHAVVLPITFGVNGWRD
jgi:hypothetical protein